MSKENICRCNKETEIAEIHQRVKDMHKTLVGNGQPGIVREFNQAKGAIYMLKYLIGGGGVIAIAALVISIIQIIG